MIIFIKFLKCINKDGFTLCAKSIPLIQLDNVPGLSNDSCRYTFVKRYSINIRKPFNKKTVDFNTGCYI